MYNTSGYPKYFAYWYVDNQMLLKIILGGRDCTVIRRVGNTAATPVFWLR